MLESLDKYFRRSGDGALGRIWLSTTLQNTIKEDLNQETKVIVKETKIIIYCRSAEGAYLLNIKKPKLLALITKTTKRKISPREVKILVER